jgi:YHS domain-containing protein
MIAQLIVLSAVAYIGYQATKMVVKSLGLGSDRDSGNEQKIPGANDMVQDPVCGLFISPVDALTIVHKGTYISFCSRECLNKFLQKQG